MLQFTKISSCIRDELKKSKPISRAEEKKLFTEYYTTADAHRKQQIFDTIILANLKFVFSVANKFTKTYNASIDDLYSEGKIGLIEGFNHYELNSRTKFISFAVWYIRRAITTYLSNSDLIRIPIAVKNNVKQKRRKNDLHDLNEREVMANNIISNLRVSTEDNSDDDDNRKNEIADSTNEGYEDIEFGDMKDVLWNMLKMTLTNDELYIIKYSFGLKDEVILPAKDIALNLHIKPNELQKMKKGAYAKIQENDVLYGILKETVNA